ncbi:MAG: hypothetical protein ACYC35_08025 [Pirellulales bacterium]
MAIGFLELVVLLLVVGLLVAVFSGKGRGLALGLLGAFGFALLLVMVVPFLAYRAVHAPVGYAQAQQPATRWVTQGAGGTGQGSAGGGETEAREGEAPAEPNVETASAPVPTPESPKAKEAPKAEPPKPGDQGSGVGGQAEAPKPAEAAPPKPAEEAPKSEPSKPAESPKTEEVPKSEPPKPADAPKPDEAPKTEPPKPADAPKAEAEPPKPAEEAPKPEPPKPAEEKKPDSQTPAAVVPATEPPKPEPPKSESPKPVETPKAETESPKPAEAPKPEPPKPAEESKPDSQTPAAVVPATEPPKPEPPKPEPPNPEPPKPEPPKPGNQGTTQVGPSDFQGTIQQSPYQPGMRIQVSPPNSSGGRASRSYRVQTGAPMPWGAAPGARYAAGGMMVIGVLVFVPILVLLANRKSRPYALGVLGVLVLLGGPVLFAGVFWMRSSVQHNVAREEQQRALAQLELERLDHGPATQSTAAAPAGVTLPAEAEPGKTPPAPKRPAWVDEPSRLDGNNVYRTKVTVGPYATRAECDQHLPDELAQATSVYLDRYLGLGAGRQAAVPLPYIHQRIVKEEWQETVQASFGPMLQLHVLLQFDDGVRNELQEMRRARLVEERIWYVTGIAGLVVVLLGTVFGFLKLDTATKGYYTGRLLLAAAAMILAVVAMGAFVCMA